MKYNKDGVLFCRLHYTSLVLSIVQPATPFLIGTHYANHQRSAQRSPSISQFDAVISGVEILLEVAKT